MVTDKLKNIDYNIVKEIVSIGNSCGVLTCYTLSVVFDFSFDISELLNIGNGMTDKQIQDYAKRNGVNFLCKENGGGSLCTYPDFHTLNTNDIVMTLSGANTNENSPHTSVLKYYRGDYFSQLFCSDNCIKQFSMVENIYPCFYYKDAKIKDFVSFRQPTNFVQIY